MSALICRPENFLSPLVISLAWHEDTQWRDFVRDKFSCHLRLTTWCESCFEQGRLVVVRDPFLCYVVALL